MNTAKARIEMMLSHLKMNANEFAKSIGLNRTDKVYNILNGRNGISSSFARDICNVHKQINFYWLTKGDGNMIKENAPESGKESNIIKITLPDMPKPELGANKHGMNLVTGMSEKLKALGYDTPNDDKGYKALVAKLADKLVDMRSQPTAQSVSEEMIGMITKPLLDRLGMVEKQKIELELRAAQLEAKLAEYERRKAE